MSRDLGLTLQHYSRSRIPPSFPNTCLYDYIFEDILPLAPCRVSFHQMTDSPPFIIQFVSVVLNFRWELQYYNSQISWRIFDRFGQCRVTKVTSFYLIKLVNSISVKSYWTYNRKMSMMHTLIFFRYIDVLIINLFSLCRECGPWKSNACREEESSVGWCWDRVWIDEVSQTTTSQLLLL